MRRGQQGVALVAVLGMMPIVALLALTGLERSLLQSRVAGSALERSVALEAAERALAEAGRSASQWARPPLQPVPALNAAAWQAVIRAEGRVLGNLAVAGSLHRPPAVLVERLSPSGVTDCAATERCAYRLSAVAPGRTAATAVVLQAVIVDHSGIRTWRELR